MRLQLLVLPLVLSLACATTAPSQVAPPSRSNTEVELTVRDADADSVALLQQEFSKRNEFKTAQLKSHSGKTAVFTVSYPGDVGDLPKALANIPHPGLKFVGALHRVEYSAFDNQPPTLSFLHPQSEQVLTTKEQFVTIEVPDKDLELVTIGGKPVEPYRGSVYRQKVTLAEGRQEIVAVARDRAGNETSAKVAVLVDTTPPALNAQIRLVVEGQVEPGSSVLINGQEVEVESDGRYKAEVPVRKGQRKVEIVAIDKNGNKSVTQKDIGL